jgi:hypothetical protein
MAAIEQAEKEFERKELLLDEYQSLFEIDPIIANDVIIILMRRHEENMKNYANSLKERLESIQHFL